MNMHNESLSLKMDPTIITNFTVAIFHFLFV